LCHPERSRGTPDPSSPLPVRERIEGEGPITARCFARDSRFRSPLFSCCHSRAAAAKNPGSFSSPLPVRERIEGEGPITARFSRATQDSAPRSSVLVSSRALLDSLPRPTRGEADARLRASGKGQHFRDSGCPASRLKRAPRAYALNSPEIILEPPRRRSPAPSSPLPVRARLEGEGPLIARCFARASRFRSAFLSLCHSERQSG
jgi:hypothetical protein